MIPLWINARRPVQSTCGWALVSVGWPWVAQRVCPMAAACDPDEGASTVRSASSAIGEGVATPGTGLARAFRARHTDPSATIATPAES